MFMKKARLFVAAAGMLALAVGCSSNLDVVKKEEAPSGKLVQGYVSGADVWADEITDAVKGSGNFNLDKKEEPTKTTSDANGDFKLGATPAYDYVLASVGGTDKLTGKPAIPMIAPKGAKNITPLTTLVAMTPPAERKALIDALGGQENYDVDIANPAGVNAEVLKISKVVENIVKAATVTTPDIEESKRTMANQINLVGLIATEIRNEIKTSNVTSLATLSNITDAQKMAAVATTAVDKAATANVIQVTPAQKDIIVAEVQTEVKKTVDTIVQNTGTDGKAKEEKVVEDTKKARLKASAVDLKFLVGSDVPVNVATWDVTLSEYQAEKLSDAVVTLGFVGTPTEVSRNTASLTITTTTGTVQKLNVIIANVFIKVENANSTPAVTLGMESSRLIIKGTRSNGTEVSAEFTDKRDVQEVFGVAGDKITVKLAAIEDKLRKREEFKDIKGFDFSAGSYAINFALSELNVFDDVKVNLTVSN